MKKVYAFLANGSEETECLAVVDVLKRAGAEVVTVSIEKDKNIVSSHNIKIEADMLLSEGNYDDADILFLPGGMPGTERLYASKDLAEILKSAYASGKHLAAICAAPLVLGQLGMLKGRECTCYGGFEKYLDGGNYHNDIKVITDGNVTTGCGLGAALELGLELVRILFGEKKQQDIARAIYF